MIKSICKLKEQQDHFGGRKILLDMFRENGNTAIIIPMKRHELADYLNMPRPSLSRELGLMRDEGIIEFDGSLIKIKNILILEKSIQ